MKRFFLDLRRLLCPLPVIRVQDRVETMSDGEVLQVACTDPGTLHDIPAWCRINGHRLMESSREGREITFSIQVCSVPSADTQSGASP